MLLLYSVKLYSDVNLNYSMLYVYSVIPLGCEVYLIVKLVRFILTILLENVLYVTCVISARL